MAADQAFHKLQPYGSAPTIEPVQLQDGRQARLILPAEDQPSSMAGQALIVTTYAEPIFIGENPFNYLILFADSDHIRSLGASLLLPPPTTAIGIDYFTVSAEDLPTAGKRLTFRWSAHGANRGIISSGTAQRFTPSWQVETVGELVVDVDGTIIADPLMALRVVNDVSGQEAIATQVLTWPCEHVYFFQPAPDLCPQGKALVTEGAYQPFERGFMIWRPRPDSSRPLIYAFAYAGQVYVFPDLWSASDPDSGNGQTPPEGLIEPVGGFGKIWREHPDVHDALGWATDTETLYNVTYQAEARESLPSVTYLTKLDGRVVQTMESIWQNHVPGQDLPGSGGGLTP